MRKIQSHVFNTRYRLSQNMWVLLKWSLKWPLKSLVFVYALYYWDKKKPLQWCTICTRCFIVASYKIFNHLTPISYTVDYKNWYQKHNVWTGKCKLFLSPPPHHHEHMNAVHCTRSFHLNILADDLFLLKCLSFNHLPIYSLFF